MDKKHLVMFALPEGGRSQNHPYWQAHASHRWQQTPSELRLRATGRLPEHYRPHHYVVNNWREHRLHPPPLG